MLFKKDSEPYVGIAAGAGDCDTEAPVVRQWQPGVNPTPKTGLPTAGGESVSLAPRSGTHESCMLQPRANRYRERLRALPPFCHAPDLLLDQALTSARLRQVRAGTVLIRPEAEGRDYLALIEGELEVCRSYVSPSGAEEIHLGRLASDANEIVLVHAMPRHTSVRAVTAARVLHIGGERIEELLAWSQRFADELRDLAPLRARMSLMGHVGPFQYLPLDHVQQALEALVPVDVEAGQVAMHQGGPGDRYYIIEHGIAEVWRTDPMTDKTVRVAVLGPGDAFGEEALLVGGVRNATVSMMVRGRLWALDKVDFESLVKPQIVVEIDAARADAMVKRKQARWLDCRYDVEFEESRIPGALHVPLDRLRELVNTLDRETPYIVYCRSGRRSACAAYLLRERGYHAYSLTGGISDWPYALEAE